MQKIILNFSDHDVELTVEPQVGGFIQVIDGINIKKDEEIEGSLLDVYEHFYQRSIKEAVMEGGKASAGFCNN